MLLAVLLTVTAMHRGAAGAANDPRNIRNGHVIPDEGYCDQPYVVITQDGNWLCTMTTGRGTEGEPGQHIVATISADQGRTWSDLIDIEPADGPVASWAMPLVTPYGRVYVFYDYNGDHVSTLGQRRNIRADMLGWFVFKYSDDNGRTWSTHRYRLPIRYTSMDYENDWNGRVQMLWGIGKPVIVGKSVYLGFSKIGKYLIDRSEGWFLRSDNILTEREPNQIDWQMLPDGDIGLRAPEGPIAEEHNLVALASGGLYTVYRTTQGYPCQAYSRDGGRTWTPPAYATYTPDGPRIRHPRACPRLWRTSNSHYLLWFHNHAGRDFQHRNPAWISGGVEIDGRIHWSQPEILLYDPDPNVRISYPDLIERDGRFWVTQTQKSIARVHEVDPALLEGLWRQHTHREEATHGLVLSVKSPPGGAELEWASLPADENAPGFTIDLAFRLDGLADGQTLVDTRDASGSGLHICTHGGSLRVDLVNEGQEASLLGDEGALAAGRTHQVVITYDAGPRIAWMLIDGRLCDGGQTRKQGWVRLPDALRPTTGGRKCRVLRPAAGSLSRLLLYNRPLRVSEAIAHQRAATQPS